MQHILNIEGYDVRKRIRVKQQAFFLQLFLVHSERNLHTVLVRPQINCARTNQTFSPHFILRLKLK